MSKKVKVVIEHTYLFQIDGKTTDEQAIAIAKTRLIDNAPFGLLEKNEVVKEYTVLND